MTGDRRNVWTDAHIAELRRLWDEGLSTRAIGEAIGFGKNSVISKSHRLDLPPRPSPIAGHVPRRRRTAEQVAARAVPKPAPPPPVAVVALPPHPPPPEPVVRACMFPHGDPGTPGFHFCGADVFRLRSPYCPTHEALCWNGYAPMRAA